MRNLKKTLCLVLALVFVLGLCTVGAADIAFTDEKDIQYKEAVEFMAGLGILKGYDDGSFKPNGTLTRAEAAKIISYVALGAEVESWPTTQVFDDVPASHWAARYVSYCSTKGIINGVGNNKFDPNGQVTLVAVMKMLLAACGYNAKGEFTGAGWDINVFNLASQIKLIQGVKAADWYAGATREETAQLAYNTLMTIVQVTYSNNTNSYVPVTINGSSNVTLGESSWGIRTDIGVVIANRSSSLTAKGTILAGTGRIMKYYVTEEDDNPNMLGHQVRITYRLENEGGSEVAKAYFIEDKCTEVKGADAVRAYDADTVYCFNAGQLVNSPIPTGTARTTAPGTFVLNEDNRVVAYKTTGYFVSYVTVNYWTQQATVFDPTINQNIAVQLPAGAVNGDLVTVYHVGDVYTAKLCAKQSYVQITSMDRDSVTKMITYNYGAIVPSQASTVYLPMNITRLDGTYQQLQLKYTYTLWFDDQGGCIGFSDASGSGTPVSADTYCLFDAVRVDTDRWGEPVYYAQVIMGDGTVKSLPISQATYASGLVNTVYKLTLYGSQYLFTPADATEMSFESYSANDGFTDYSGATFIQYSGTKSSLTAAPTAKRPKANSAVYILYSTERSVGIYMRRVKSVWFQTAASSDTPVSSNNIIYTTGAVQSGGLINGSPVYYYEGYMNGAPMTDLVTSTAPAPGFYYAGKNVSTSLYTLNAVPNGDGSKTGVRTFTLVNNTDQTVTYDSGIGNGVLYLRDSAGNMRTMSLAGVAVIPVGEAAYSMYPINSVSALQNAVVGNQKVTVTLVEVVSGSNHSVGGNAIYVTAISQ